MTKPQTSSKRVHLIFKSHLDMGFTNTADKVVQQYFNDFIPRALETARLFRGSATPFVWITGAWIIHQFLEKGPGHLIPVMEEAIENGEIGWHALPFTYHSEAAGDEILRAGMEFSKELDSRFGIKTVAAKMTDVPGHSLGLIPILNEAEVFFLHIGINDVSHPVDLPPLFRWRHPEGSEIIVNYQRGYGDTSSLPGFNEVLFFHHKHDNMGPPDAKEVKMAYADCSRRFPGSLVKASTLNDFAVALQTQRENLPVVCEEMGDTWIHGIGTDPAKIARYRQIIRLMNDWKKQKLSPSQLKEITAMKRALTLIPEHTWGLDLKTYLPDYIGYEKEAFQKTRQNDILDESVQKEGIERFVQPYAFLTEDKIPQGPKSFRFFEESWQEQRSYLDEAISVIRSAPLRQQLDASLAEISSNWPDLREYKPVEAQALRSCENWDFSFDGRTGALRELQRHGIEGRLIKPGASLGLFEYEVFSQKEYDTFQNRYIRSTPENDWWALQDYMKCGLAALTNHQYGRYHPAQASFFCKEGKEGFHVAAQMKMPEESVARYGAPGDLMLLYCFHRKDARIEISLFWKGKDALRIPEASWLRFGFSPGCDEGWTMNKLNTMISPFAVRPMGNRALHSVDALQYNPYSEGDVEEPPRFLLKNLDSPLLSPGEPRILRYDNEQPDLDQGFAVNLHNNLWNTNFPMWYEEDLISRFILDMEESDNDE